MYKMKLWDEDKWNIHSSGYHSSKSGGSDDKKYHEKKYGSKEKEDSSDYMRREEGKEKDEEKRETIFENLEEAKPEKEEMKEDEIPFKAAKQIFNESRLEAKKADKKKDIHSIEEAIKKAIEDEKKVVVMD